MLIVINVIGHKLNHESLILLEELTDSRNIWDDILIYDLKNQIKLENK